MTDFLDLAQQAYDASSSYMDTNWRPDLDYSLRAFRNEHAAGSKYNSDEYRSRSRLFPPKTRSVIRKNEAAAMQAAFSNREMVSVEAQNPDDLMNVASAESLKYVMQYRLSRTIQTFETYLGGVQDAQTTGAVCSYQYWEYEKRGGKKIKDRPCIELVPIENVRFDAGASWLDPVNSSPYFCHIVPMYVCDVQTMMNSEDDKTGQPKWKKFDEATIAKARPDIMDSTRKARLGGMQDPADEAHAIKAFDIVWVMRWCMRERGDDMFFYTLGTEELLTTPKPLEDEYFHGVRPWVIGYAILETHKALKTSMPVLVRPLQAESTDISNQRLDNVKYVLNKRMYVARGRQVDTNALVRNVPGAVIMMSDPKNDVIESNHADVTSSSFVEHDRVNSQFDDLAGNFSPSTKVANNAVNDTLGGSRMASAGAGLMTEYLIRTINETWWEKVMRQLALLEQHYETDEVILAICANKAQLFPRFGISRITDMMIIMECTVSVDMTMGDPLQRNQKFLAATNAAMQLRMNPAPGQNSEEITKEIFSNAGYRDGTRFFSDKQDPMVVKLTQMVQQLHAQLNGKQMELQAGAQVEQLKLASAEKIKGAEIQVDAHRIDGDLRIREAELAIEQGAQELERMKIQAELQGADQDMQVRMAEIGPRIEEAQLKLQMAREKAQHDLAKQEHDLQKSALELAAKQAEANTAQQSADNESKIGKVADDVTGSMRAIAAELESMRSRLDGAHGGIGEMKTVIGQLGQGMGMIANTVVQMQNKKKPKGMRLRKNGKATESVMIDFDDGSTEEMPVGTA